MIANDIRGRPEPKMDLVISCLQKCDVDEGLVDDDATIANLLLSKIYSNNITNYDLLMKSTCITNKDREFIAYALQLYYAEDPEQSADSFIIKLN